jgi:hypothetical protein
LSSVAVMAEGRGGYRVLVWKPEGKRPLGRPRRRWVDYIKWIFMKWDVGLWTRLSWLRIRTSGGHRSIRCGEFLD